MPENNPPEGSHSDSNSGSGLIAWLKRRAENVAVALLTAMFFTFILQIVFRYVLRSPLGWTIEACLLAWLWIVFWGAAFLLDDRDHVRFDILYNHAGPRMRRAFGVLAACAIIAAMVSALPATLDYIQFMKIESTSLLKIRFDYVFSIYLIFSLAIIIRYSGRIFTLLRNASLIDSENTLPKA